MSTDVFQEKLGGVRAMKARPLQAARRNHARPWECVEGDAR